MRGPRWFHRRPFSLRRRLRSRRRIGIGRMHSVHILLRSFFSLFFFQRSSRRRRYQSRFGAHAPHPPSLSIGVFTRSARDDIYSLQSRIYILVATLFFLSAASERHSTIVPPRNTRAERVLLHRERERERERRVEDDSLDFASSSCALPDRF